MSDTTNGSFWKLSKPSQISMWIIGLVFAVLFFTLGKESIDREVGANASMLGIHEVRIERIETDAVELKQDIKEALKEQRAMIQDIHKIIMEE